MGKGTDKLYITHSEWASTDAYSASVGAAAGTRARSSTSNASANTASFKRLPFNYCAASLQPFRNPVCTVDGTIFDAEVIAAWLSKRKTNPVNGKPLAAKDLIKLNFARNADGEQKSGGEVPGDLIDPVSYKVFTDNTHVVALRHGTYANVFAWDTVQRMNIAAKHWRDLVDDAPFTRADIITLQDPHHAETRDLARFRHLANGGEALPVPSTPTDGDGGDGDTNDDVTASGVNVAALGRMGDKLLRAKLAVERARKARDVSGADVNRSGAAVAARALSATTTRGAGRAHNTSATQHPPTSNTASYTTGRAAASFTSTGLTPETHSERAILTDEELMLQPRRVRHRGYARLETSLGDLDLELQTEWAPRAVWNFVRLAQRGFYKGLKFHRNIPGFMIQGGDPTGTGRGGTSVWGKNFKDEFYGPLSHAERGIVSMANKGRDTNSSQFFITYQAVAHLDRKHTIFAKVVGGMEVLKKMEETPTDGSDRPLNKIVIKDVVVYIDPFELFMKERGELESAEAMKAKKAANGGDDDDKMTWTGKRIRQDGVVEENDGIVEGVGKYLKHALKQQQGDGERDAWDDQYTQPVKKKLKPGAGAGGGGGGSGGFGNFDSW